LPYDAVNQYCCKPGNNTTVIKQCSFRVFFAIHVEQMFWTKSFEFNFCLPTTCKFKATNDRNYKIYIVARLGGPIYKPVDGQRLLEKTSGFFTVMGDPGSGSEVWAEVRSAAIMFVYICIYVI
jgi:hypothetical protein